MTALDLARRGGKLAALLPGLLARRRPDDLVVLLYHRVGVGDRQIDLRPEDFDMQMKQLSETDRLLHIDDAIDGPQTGGVVITFDDGYGDFYRHSLPVLVRHQIPATLYLTTGQVCEEQSPRKAVDDPISWSQLREAISTGLVTVGAHTHNHRILAGQGAKYAEEEMRRSKDLIEGRLEVACRHFSYPWAVTSPEADRVARDLFDSAATYAWRTNRAGRTDRYSLGRIPILRSDGPFFFKAKVHSLLNGEAILYRMARRGPWRHRDDGGTENA